jgi:hypothetical protein
MKRDDSRCKWERSPTKMMDVTEIRRAAVEQQRSDAMGMGCFTVYVAVIALATLVTGAVVFGNIYNSAALREVRKLPSVTARP